MSANVVEIIPPKTSPPADAGGSDKSGVPKKMFGLDTRFVPPILITLILLAGQLSYGILESYPQTLLAIFTAIVFEIALSRIVTGKYPHLASAYITGISVGILIRSPEFWTFALCAAISITSKYVLRYKDRHLWNPSNFGVSFMLFVAPFAVAGLSIQWGNNIWALVVIWLLGSIIIYRLGRFHITITYILSFLAFGLLRSFFTGHPFLAEAAPITSPMYQLFIFFMITDPKTTVRSSKKAQILVAFLVALVEMLLRLTESIHAPYYALFIVGPIANFIDIRFFSKKSGRSQ
jgi:Na+-translocating ferredoxin:NAD+ oxidoreductase RnfD subunit